VARRASFLFSWAIRILMAAFFAFVGYWKALGPYAALAEHHAWVAGFPAWFARAVGWSEILCSVALILPVARLRGSRPAAWAATLLVLNQAVALAVHVARDETAAVPQNLVIIALLGALLWLLRGGNRNEENIL
jgi:uncharacterized membrane protein YphA (DoxX/SURF4 family)